MSSFSSTASLSVRTEDCTNARKMTMRFTSGHQLLHEQHMLLLLVDMRIPSLIDCKDCKILPMSNANPFGCPHSTKRLTGRLPKASELSIFTLSSDGTHMYPNVHEQEDTDWKPIVVQGPSLQSASLLGTL
eukprot:6299088-Amphidinium_carterae.1